MGDRANVKVVDGPSTVFLYTHWGRHNLPQVLQASLKRGEPRWNDGQYLARIIFSDIVKGHEDTLVGFGISSVAGDGEDHVLEVNVDKQTVSFGKKWSMSFADFVAEADPGWG